MTVEYFTPSKRDIEEAPGRLLFYKRWGHYSCKNDLLPDQTEMTIIDFSHLYTEEEKAQARQYLSVDMQPSGRIEFTSHQPYDTARAKAMARHVLGNSPLQPLNEATVVEIRTSYGSKSGKPKDFTPVPVRSVMPDVQVSPTYRVKEVKVINGQKVTFYGQDLPKEKS